MEENNKISENFITVLKNEDIQNYAGEGIWNLIQALFTGDVFSGVSAGKNIKELIFHLPTANFWAKMQRFLLGTYRNFEEQVKMSSKFDEDNEKYKEYVYMMIETVDKIDSMAKIDYFSNLTRVYLLEVIDEGLFYKLRQLLLTCNHIELSFIKESNMEKHYKNDMMIFSLKTIGLIEQEDNDEYIFTNLAKSLKTYALSDDETSKPVVKYLELSAPKGVSTVTEEAIEALFGGSENSIHIIGGNR